MTSLPNILSCSRLPLALLFFVTSSVSSRLLIIFLAMMSDGLDGFLARRYGWRSRLGALLDPIMDKLFVAIILIIFWSEQKLLLWEGLTLLSRDIAVILFGVYLWWINLLSKYRVRAILAGKLMTFLQFLIFGALTLGYTVPPVVFIFFALIGVLALVELFYRLPKLAR